MTRLTFLILFLYFILLHVFYYYIFCLYRGMVPAVAEMRYLERVKWLDLYGSDLHPVLVSR